MREQLEKIEQLVNKKGVRESLDVLIHALRIKEPPSVIMASVLIGAGEGRFAVLIGLSHVDGTMHDAGERAIEDGPPPIPMHCKGCGRLIENMDDLRFNIVIAPVPKRDE